MDTRTLLLVAGIALLITAAGCIGLGPENDDPLEPSDLGDEGGFSDTHVFDGEYSAEEPHALVPEEGPYDLLPGESLYLDSQVDDAAIEVGYVLPDIAEDEQVPVILFASPYLPVLHATDLHEVHERLTDNFVPHGYAVAFVAVRGTADSGGCSELMGPVERSDLDQAVTWLGEQEWSNGNVGMLGVSYDGSTPWMVAAEGNEHLKTILPISGVNDPFHLMYRNGTAEDRGPVVLNALYYGWFAMALPDRSPQHIAEAAVCPTAKQGFAASVHSSATGERDPLEYWQERNMRPLVEENYNGSIFLIHGLQDWNVDPGHAYPWVSHLDEQGVPVKHLLGQWGHAWPDGDYLPEDQRRLDFAQILLNWFDYWLKEDTTADLGPAVQVQDQTGQWRSADAWPPEGAEEVTFHLAPEGALSTEPADETASVPVTADEASLFGNPTGAPTGCQGCAVFTTGALKEDLRFAGWPPLHVTTTPTGPTGHLTAHLYAANGDDWQRLGMAMMDLRFADGGDQAEPITPGEERVAKMQLEPLDVVVEEGQELVLVISQGNQQGMQFLAPPSPVMLEVGGGQSTLTVDAFTVTSEETFEPPT